MDCINNSAPIKFAIFINFLYLNNMNNELILNKTAEDNKQIISNPQAMFDIAMQFQQLMMMYEGGIKQISTKLEILQDDFESKHLRNPIESISSRIKEPMSIADKLQRKGLSVTIDNIVENLYDVAGIRVTCPFISDVYKVTELLLAHDDIKLIKKKDYIKKPKQNGYRSLHLIVEVAVYFSDQKRSIPVEIQIRTIAMDFWAALEHQLHYKKNYTMPQNVEEELKSIADVIASNDKRMQKLADDILDK